MQIYANSPDLKLFCQGQLVGKIQRQLLIVVSYLDGLFPQQLVWNWSARFHLGIYLLFHSSKEYHQLNLSRSTLVLAFLLACNKESVLAQFYCNQRKLVDRGGIQIHLERALFDFERRQYFPKTIQHR